MNDTYSEKMKQTCEINQSTKQTALSFASFCRRLNGVCRSCGKTACHLSPSRSPSAFAVVGVVVIAFVARSHRSSRAAVVEIHFVAADVVVVVVGVHL